jgi:hypothetical protein
MFLRVSCFLIFNTPFTISPDSQNYRTTMIKFTSYFQHHWWLYICWLIQMPAICFIIFMGISYSYWVCMSICVCCPYNMSILTFSHGSRLQLSFCCIMVLLYIYQFIFYFIHRLNATRMLCLQVYGSVFITYLGYWEGWAFLPGNTIWGSLLPGILTTTAYGFTLLYVLLADKNSVIKRD